MTDATRQRLSRGPLGPEQVAALITSIAVILGGLTVASTMGTSGRNAPSASVASGILIPAATAHPFAATASLVLQLHERLAEDQAIIEEHLANSEFDTPGVVATIRRLNSTARLAAGLAESLTKTPGSRELGKTLMDLYVSVGDIAEDALGTSVGDAAAYRAAAKRLSVALEPIASLQQRLRALIASTRATPPVAAVPTASASSAPTEPPPTATPSSTPRVTPQTPSPTPIATPTPTPSAVTAPPSQVPLDGQVLNPGFEATDSAPWVLVVEAPAAATLTLDASAGAYEGERSARIDITATSDNRTAIALHQTGIEVAQGHRYVCRAALRADASREVRLRVASASGATYGTRLVTIGTSWTIIEFEFGAFVENPAAVLEIDLGRSAPTTWIDAVQITDLSVPAPG